MGRAFFGFSQFPLELKRICLEQMVITLGVAEAVKLRFVCNFFDQELPVAFSNTRILECDQATTSPLVGHKLVVRYLVDRAVTDGTKHQNLSSRFHCILRLLGITQDPNIAGSFEIYRKALTSLANASICPNGIHKALRLLDETKPGQLTKDTFKRDYIGAAALLGKEDIFDDIIAYVTANPVANLDSNIEGTNGGAFIDSPLTLAALGGQDTLVSKILETKLAAGPSLQHPAELEFALHTAITQQHEGIVHLILEYKYSCPKTGHLEAARTGNWTILSLLCKHSKQSLGQPEILTELAQYGHEKLVRWCLVIGNNRQVNEMHRSSEWRTALGAAASRGRNEIVRLLIAKGANQRFYVASAQPLLFAASNGHKDTVQILLDHGAVPVSHTVEYSPLFKAARNGHADVVEVLLDSGIDIQKQHKVAAYHGLREAAARGYETAVRLLISRGVCPDGLNEALSPMVAARKHGQVHIVEVLLELGAKPVGGAQWQYRAQRARVDDFRAVKLRPVVGR